MSKLPLHIQKAIRTYQPIETEGLTFWPILVSEYHEYLTAKPAIEIMQQALPVRWLSMPLLSALYGMDFEAFQKGEPRVGLFSRCLLFLALSLRLGKGREVAERTKLFTILVDAEDPGQLKALRFTGDDGEEKEITPIMFQRLRPILAIQNGIELASEDANPDLVEAERDLAEMNGPELEVSLDSLFSTIAAMAGIDEAEIDDWPILKLNRRQKAYSRVLNYVVCGIGEAQGTKWKGGNPYPSPFYDKVRNGSSGAMRLEEFAGGAGVRAVQNAGVQTPL